MKGNRMINVWGTVVLLFILAHLGNDDLFPFFVPMVFAHCDTMDGPVIKDAQKALETKNVKIVLKWVQPADEKETGKLFNQTLEVRQLNPKARELADMYFFENLVRIHRAGEGASYEGIKPAGSEVEPGIAAADKAVETGAVGPLADEISEHVAKSIRGRFEDLQQKKVHAEESVEAGREYVESYVTFIHYIEKLHQVISQKEVHGEGAETVKEHGH